MLKLAKKMATFLPRPWQRSLHKKWYAWRIRNGKFIHNEPEYKLLSDWVHAGETVLDIGANIGIFTSRLSSLVGETGHVFAFEPMPVTFAFLTSNADMFPHRNITLLNVGASETSRLARMEMPLTDTGLMATARASISDENGSIPIYCVRIDSLMIQEAVSFVKIDVEGHEFPVLKGMKELLQRDHPRLIIEGDDPEISSWLQQLGYRPRTLPNSPNTIFEYDKPAA